MNEDDDLFEDNLRRLLQSACAPVPPAPGLEQQFLQAVTASQQPWWQRLRSVWPTRWSMRPALRLAPVAAGLGLALLLLWLLIGNAGRYQPASLGDYVWLDANRNGVQDEVGPGVAGVAVALYTGAGTFVAETTTDAAGHYAFRSLPPGDYYLVFTAPAGYTFTAPDVGADDALDSDTVPATGRTAPTMLAPGENDLTWDAGLCPLAAAGVSRSAAEPAHDLDRWND